jgi:hypothetical protein
VAATAGALAVAGDEGTVGHEGEDCAPHPVDGRIVWPVTLTGELLEHPGRSGGVSSGFAREATVTRPSMIGHQRGRVLLGCALALLLCAGCSGASAPPAQPTAPAAPAAGTAPPPRAPAPDHGVGPYDMAPPTPQDAALKLESLRGQHALRAADMMRGRIRNDEDLAQAANAALGRNTNDLAQLVGALFGAPASDRFRTLWADHVNALFTYSRSQATDDGAARDQARTALVMFENNLAEFFASAAGGRLPQATARSALLAHVNHLLEQADAYAMRDYPRSNAAYRQGYAHTVQLGHTLATTLLPPDQAVVLEEPQWRLRSELGRQLGEHVALAIGTLRAGATDSPDFTAAAAALDGNTSDLGTDVGSLFGQPAGSEFLTLWADHIDQLVGYTAGVAGGDEGKRAAARAALRDVERRLAGFLDAAGGGRLGSPALAQALFAHDDTLLRQVDAFAAKDYQQANDLSYRAYQDMFGLARQLSDAFGAAVAARLPEGGAQTGAGGTVRQPR